ncbi:hypothetical protein FOL47_008664 [Perkinsus chesapeaki]|uniref:Tyr recombinase domain-containing protein n=1 Tax=Perkinsus chesapeaki TaxID=330153 RepID=A0A7J6LD58_PERCH|nr:hypothetical protein FOL47_008664 [Perkinsus chesapeaki]
MTKSYGPSAEFWRVTKLHPLQLVDLFCSLLKAGLFLWKEARQSISGSVLLNIPSLIYRRELESILIGRHAKFFRDCDNILEALIYCLTQARTTGLIPTELSFDTPPPSAIASRVISMGSHDSGRLELESFRRSILFLPLCALTDSTFRQYAVGFRSYVKFAFAVSSTIGCSGQPSTRLPLLPASEEVVLMWLSTFRNADTASNYLSHVRKWHSWLNLGMTWDTFMISQCIKGLKRLAPGVKRPRSRIGPDLLQKFVKQAFARGLPVIALAAIISYAFMLRVQSELLQTHVDDVELSENHVILRLRHRKNVPNGEALLRYCTCATNSLLCPVEAFKLLIRVKQLLCPQGLAVCGSLTYRSFLIHIRSILGDLKVEEADQYGTHSFRRGHAHALAVSGSSQEEICRAGSWRYRSSVPAKLYVDIGQIEAIACRQALPEIDDSDTENDSVGNVND